MSRVDARADEALPNVDWQHFDKPHGGRLDPVGRSAHAPRILMRYGSLRVRSYSRLPTLE